MDIPLTKGYVATIDDEDFPLVENFSWRAHAQKKSRTVYAIAYLRGSGRKNKVVSMHRVLLGSPEGMQIDHRDGDGINNRRTNLRVCSVTQNARNHPKRHGCTSRFRGISFQKKRGKWLAQIRVDGRTKHLGYFQHEEEAARAYDAAADMLFGDFARLNFGTEA